MLAPPAFFPTWGCAHPPAALCPPSQAAFIGALAAARRFADTASRELGLRVYPYSVFHVFFEQYLTPAR